MTLIFKKYKKASIKKKKNERLFDQPILTKKMAPLAGKGEDQLFFWIKNVECMYVTHK